MYSHQSLAEERLFDLRPWPEESCKIRSVYPSFCPSFRLSVSFLGIGFSKTWHNVRGPYIVVCDSQIFCKKSPSGKKRPQNMVFGLFKKTTSLVLPEICVKSKFLWFINILQKLYTWEKSRSLIKDKNGSRPMRVQYPLFISISLID